MFPFDQNTDLHTVNNIVHIVADCLADSGVDAYKRMHPSGYYLNSLVTICLSVCVCYSESSAVVAVVVHEGPNSAKDIIS